jgi:hypothetical protein
MGMQEVLTYEVAERYTESCRSFQGDRLSAAPVPARVRHCNAPEER